MNMSAASCRKQWPDCYDMMKIFIGKPTEQSNMKILLKISTKEKKFEGASQWLLNDWMSFLAKGGGAKKRYQYCLNPNSSRHISCFRAIQGHSGGIAINPELQDKVLLPTGFASTTSGMSVKYIQKLEVGSSSPSDLMTLPLFLTATSVSFSSRSVIHIACMTISTRRATKKKRLEVGWSREDLRLKRGRQSVFFMIVYPMDCSTQNIWKLHHNTVNECNLKLAQERGLPFYRTRSQAMSSTTHYQLCLHR